MITENEPPAPIPKRPWFRSILVRWLLLASAGAGLLLVGLVVFRSFNQTNFNLSDPKQITPLSSLPAAALAANNPGPAERLAEGATFMEGVQSLHLNWQIRQGKLNVGQAEVKAASADLLQPDKFRAQVKVQILFASFELPVIGVGNEQFQRDELGNWHRSKPEESINLTGIIDKKIGIGPTLLKLQNPRLIGLEAIDGLTAYHLEGLATAETIAGLTSNRLGQRDGIVEVWLDQAQPGQLDQFSIKQPEEAGQTGSLNWWVFRFTSFNQPLIIDKPKVN